MQMTVAAMMPCPGCHGTLVIDLKTRAIVCQLSGYKTTYAELGNKVRGKVDAWMTAHNYKFLEPHPMAHDNHHLPSEGGR